MATAWQYVSLGGWQRGGPPVAAVARRLGLVVAATRNAFAAKRRPQFGASIGRRTATGIGAARRSRRPGVNASAAVVVRPTLYSWPGAAVRRVARADRVAINTVPAMVQKAVATSFPPQAYRQAAGLQPPSKLDRAESPKTS